MITLACDQEDLHTQRVLYRITLINRQNKVTTVIEFENREEAMKQAYAHKSGARNYSVFLSILWDVRIHKQLRIERP